MQAHVIQTVQTQSHEMKLFQVGKGSFQSLKARFDFS